MLDLFYYKKINQVFFFLISWDISKKKKKRSPGDPADPMDMAMGSRMLH